MARARPGVFIVPPEHRTYLVHCDIAQHMEKGMKGQLKVGRGSGDLWGIPGVSGAFFADSYLPENIVDNGLRAGRNDADRAHGVTQKITELSTFKSCADALG